MNINGKNGLACITKLKELKEPVELRPLPGLPVIRDLIVDMTPVLQAVPLDQAVPGQRRRRRRRRSACSRRRTARSSNGLYECILCACCSTACPSFWWNPGQVRRSGGSAAGVPLHRRHARPGDQRAARQSRRSVPAVPLPHDHELRRRVPEGPQSDEAIGKIKESWSGARCRSMRAATPAASRS